MIYRCAFLYMLILLFCLLHFVGNTPSEVVISIQLFPDNFNVTLKTIERKSTVPFSCHFCAETAV